MGNKSVEGKLLVKSLHARVVMLRTFRLRRLCADKLHRCCRRACRACDSSHVVPYLVQRLASSQLKCNCVASSMTQSRAQSCLRRAAKSHLPPRSCLELARNPCEVQTNLPSVLRWDMSARGLKVTAHVHWSQTAPSPVGGQVMLNVTLI